MHDTRSRSGTRRASLLAALLTVAVPVAAAGCQGVIGDGPVEQVEGGEHPPGPDAISDADIYEPDATPGPDGSVPPDPTAPHVGIDHPWVNDDLGLPWPTETGGGEQVDPDCVDDITFFAETAWPTVFASQCLGCHNADGIAASSRHVLVDAYQEDHLQTNLAVLASLAPLELDGQPLLLAKPTGVQHAGGKIFDPGSDSYQILEELLARFESPTLQCETVEDPGGDGDPDPTPQPPTVARVADHLTLMSPADTLRVATLSLTGRLPDESETAAVEAGGEAALQTALRALLEEEAFYGRVKEIYNDLLLTNLYDVDDNAIELLDLRDFPNRFWFDLRRVGSGQTNATQAEMDAAMIHGNHSVATEPLELIAHVVRENRPLTEILTADYAVMNAFAARSYDAYVDGLWTDPADPEEHHEVRIPGREHAGVLSSIMFLNRFPNTNTNLNRHRARMVFHKFLATDILAIAERPIDLDSVLVDDPTANAPACTVCHSVMDPVAATFRSWTGNGRYIPGASHWSNAAFPPGFGSDLMPPDEVHNSLRWLVVRLVADPRFATATVNLWFESLTGYKPLLPPQDPSDPEYARELQLFQVQNADLQALANDFIASNYDLKALIEAIILSPYFRANGVSGGDAFDDSQVGWQLQIYGLGRPLTPVQLHRKIVGTLGYPYRSNASSRDYLTGIFRVPYGGINSDDVIDRMRDFNGMMGNIALRMANHMACIAVPQDFAQPTSQRLLFPVVERTAATLSVSGELEPATEAAVRDNLVHLHSWLLGEHLTPGAPEIDATLSLFISTLAEGQAALANGTANTSLDAACRASSNYWSGVTYDASSQVVDDPNYAVRAWMAVVSYMLMDYRFLHQ